MADRKCLTCGEPLEPTGRNGPERRYCSNACIAKMYRLRKKSVQSYEEVERVALQVRARLALDCPDFLGSTEEKRRIYHDLERFLEYKAVPTDERNAVRKWLLGNPWALLDELM